MNKRLLTTVGIATLLLLAEGIWVYAFLPVAADASRNSSGTYSTPNTFVTGTVISSTSVNANFSDIATEMTDSLDRSGKGGMLAALRGIDGTVAAPAFSWTSETGSGLYRIGSNNPGFAVNGSKRQEWSTTGTTVTGTLAVSGATTLSSTLATTGTTTSTGIFRAPDGTVTSPGISFTSEDDGSGTGFYMGGGQSMRVAANGGEVTRFEPTKVTVNASAGLQVGSSGTAISASYRGTTSWTPGSLNAGICASTAITLTGTAAGADCVATGPTGTGAGNFTFGCDTTLNTCTLHVCNSTTGALTPGSGTYACRTFNP